MDTPPAEPSLVALQLEGPEEAVAFTTWGVCVGGGFSDPPPFSWVGHIPFHPPPAPHTHLSSIPMAGQLFNSMGYHGSPPVRLCPGVRGTSLRHATIAHGLPVGSIFRCCPFSDIKGP